MGSNRLTAISDDHTPDVDARQTSSVTSVSDTLTVKSQWKGLDLAATGMYAGALLTAVALIAFLVWGDPLHNAQHFLLTMITCFVAGAFFTGGVWHGRLRDAIQARNDFRVEMNRMADRNQALERSILKNRLSSVATPAESHQQTLGRSIKPIESTSKARGGR